MMKDQPLLPEFLQAGHAQHVEMEADPGEGEDEAEAPQHQAVQLDNPSQGGDAGTVKFEDETLLPFTCRGREVIKILLSFITEGRDILTVSTTLMGQTNFASKHIEGFGLPETD